MDTADLLISSNSSNSSTAAAAGGGASQSSGGRLPDAVAAQAAALMQAAVDEGFMAALTISRTNADALVRAREAFHPTCSWYRALLVQLLV